MANSSKKNQKKETLILRKDGTRGLSGGELPSGMKLQAGETQRLSHLTPVPVAAAQKGCCPMGPKWQTWLEMAPLMLPV